MRAICNALVMLLLLSGPADGATFNERWSGLIVKSAPHRVAHHHIVRQRDWHRYVVRGSFTCGKHVWHGKHWRCENR
jgi:hypothetical protein